MSNSLWPHGLQHLPAGLPVHHQHLEFTQTHIHWVGDSIKPSHPLSSPYPPAHNLSQHQFNSVQSLSHIRLFATPRTAALQTSLSITNSRSPPNPCPSSRWCHPTISSSVFLFSSCPQSFPASGSFPMCQLFASGRQSIGVSSSVSVLPMNIQDWFPLGLIGWISLQSKGLWRVFSNTTVQKHQVFGAQLSFFFFNLNLFILIGG